MLKLLDRGVSGNCWRVRLLLGFLGMPYTRVEVDILRGENRSALFQRINPRCQVPVLLEHDDTGLAVSAIWDSCAILVYLAARYEPTWLAQSPDEQARQQQWLSVASVEHQVGIRAARGARLFGVEPPGFSLQAAQTIGRRGLEIMDAFLARHAWLAADRPTVADVACYPYARLANDADIDLDVLPALSRCLDAVEALPGFSPQRDAAHAPGQTWAAVYEELERAFRQRAGHPEGSSGTLG